VQVQLPKDELMVCLPAVTICTVSVDNKLSSRSTQAKKYAT